MGDSEMDWNIEIGFPVEIYSCSVQLGVCLRKAPELQDLMDKASNHHVHCNPHHPEYWSKERASEGTTIDCTSMPLSYVASMCADWLAMSEELKNSAVDWADKNVNKRWIFSDGQVELIYYLLKNLK